MPFPTEWRRRHPARWSLCRTVAARPSATSWAGSPRPWKARSGRSRPSCRRRCSRPTFSRWRRRSRTTTAPRSGPRWRRCSPRASSRAWCEPGRSLTPARCHRTCRPPPAREPSCPMPPCCAMPRSAAGRRGSSAFEGRARFARGGRCVPRRCPRSACASSVPFRAARRCRAALRCRRRCWPRSATRSRRSPILPAPWTWSPALCWHRPGGS